MSEDRHSRASTLNSKGDPETTYTRHGGRMRSTVLRAGTAWPHALSLLLAVAVGPGLTAPSAPPGRPAGRR